jgi:hypothetical protein
MKTGEVLRLIAGIAAAPAAWMLQMLLSNPLVSGLCAARRPGLPLALNLISLACLLAACAGAWAAWSMWRAERGHSDTADHREAVDRGTTPLAFVALLGMMVSAMFIVAIGFSSLAPLLVASCARGP